MTYRSFVVAPLLLLPLFCSATGFTASAPASLPPAASEKSAETPKNGIQRPISPKAAAAQAARDAALRQRSYILGPGDIVRVTVPEFPDFSVDLMTVLPNGTVALPFYGTLKANGRSIEDVQSELRRLLVKRIKPQFANTLVLSVPQPRPLIENPDPLPVFMQVLGAVKSQGPVEIRDGFRISEAIGVAGGPASGRLDSVKVTLARGGEPLRDIDLVEISQKPDSPANIEVRPLDVITVTEIQEVSKTIAIYGAVNKPGVFSLRRLPQLSAFELPEKPHLSEALLMAGSLSVPPPVVGTTPIEDGARQYTGFLMRGQEKILLNVQDALSKKDPSADIVLQPSDYITIEMVPLLTVRVDGQVLAPGQFQMTPGARFLDGLVKAGGPKTDVKEIVASIWRHGEEIPIDLGKTRLNSNDPRLNVLLENNDVLQFELPDIINVQIAGAVPKPQAVKLPVGARIMDALANAGGLNPGLKPEKTTITVMRRDTNDKLINLDIEPVKLQQLKPDQNIALHEGDVITVTEVKPEVKYASIGGEVNKQGTVEFEDDLDLQELIVRAGGPTDKAALSRVVVQRDGKAQIVDVYDAIKSGKPLNFTVQNRDLVTIPQHTDHVTVMEAVVHPGAFPIPERGKLTLSDALSAAGGRQANARDIVLIRQNPADPNHPSVKIINPYPTGKNKQPTTQDLQQELQDGDVVYVYPGQVTESKSRTILNLLGPLGLLLRLR